MTGLFADIRRYFQQDYSGRYIAVLLRELARHDPHSFSEVIHYAAGKSGQDWKQVRSAVKIGSEFQTEYGFDGAQGRRKADLAIIFRNEPLLYLEVKEDDVKNPKNLAQVLDYVRTEVPFVYLSRFAPEPADQQAIDEAKRRGQPVASIRYRDIHRVLGRTRTHVAKMVREYLEDIHVGTYVPIDLDRQLASCMTQLLGFPHQHGLGRLHSNESVGLFPKLIQRMLDNVEYAAEWVHQANRKSIQTRFTRKMWLEPEFDLSGLSKSVQKGTDAIGPLPGSGRYVKGGCVVFYGIGTLRTSAPSQYFLNAELGFGLHMKRGTRSRPSAAKSLHAALPLVQCYLYTQFRGTKLDPDSTQSATEYLKKFPAESTALKHFHKLLSKSHERALQLANGAVLTALKEFRVPPLP